MSKQMKLISAVAGVLVLAAVVLTMFGKPPNLPLGPLQGMLAKDEEITATDAAGTDAGALGSSECGPGATTPGSGTGAVDPATADPAAGGAAATDPAAGAPADPAAGAAADPAAGGAAGAGTAPGATDPTAPVAGAADGWTGDARVLAADDGGYDPGRVSDSTTIVAAEAPVDPAATAPGAGATDPAAAGATADPAAGAATTDPAAGGVTDPAAGGVTDPAAGGVTDPAAADPAAGTAIDPCADAAAAADPSAPGSGAATDPGAGAVGAGAAGAAGGAGGAAAPGAGGAPAVAASTTDGTNTGNSPEALRAAKDATGVMQKAQITVSTTATLVPSAGGIAKLGPLRRYRTTVTGAVLVIKLDAAAQDQWTSAGKKVQTQLVRSFLTRLAKSYTRASRSITITDSTGNVLALGDAPPGRPGTVKLL